jgi:hypothetical protein
VGREAGAKPTARAGRGEERGDEKAVEWWVGVLRWVALAVFVAIPVAAPFVQTVAGRAVWTVLVAALPLFIVLVGYHRWRRLCPLAFFAQLPAMLGRPGRRKAPPWLEANYYYLVVFVFVVSLWLRLIATNGDGAAISTFFLLLTGAALISGLFFTGKTWCNYLCPVSFVEKIYTEPHGLRETPNSQCEKCTACKKFCPDINEENGYWKEIASRPKRLAYFAFPGLVFGFYFYYYLQSGTWSYYFGGSWTNEPRLFASAFSPGTDASTAGLFFFPAVPRAVASLLVLVLCGLLSLLLFTAVERGVGRWLRVRGGEAEADLRRHLTFSLAAFAAFVTFYTFAGAPTLWKLPWAVPHLFLILVVLTATAFLLRRLGRTQKRFAEETLARNILRRWEWADEQAPRDLREAFLVHTIRTSEVSRNAARVLEIYREAVREALAEGFVSREDVQKLERLRAQLNIRKADHDKLMSALAADDRALLGDPTRHLPPEKWLQLKTYERALEKYLAEAPEGADEDEGAFLTRLRQEYRVTKEEHDAVLDRLGGGRKVLAARLASEVDVIERASAAIRRLEEAPSPLRDFLAYLLRRRRDTACARLLNVVGVSGEDARAARAGRQLSDGDRAVRQAGLAELGRAASPLVAEHLAVVAATVADYGAAPPDELLNTYTRSVDPYVRAAAVLALPVGDADRAEALARLRGDESALVREEVGALEAGEGSEAPHSPTTLEKMLALHAVALFSELEPEELEELARACRPAVYEAGAVVCAEGERGDHVFVILAGEVRVVRGRRGEEAELVSVERAGSVLGEMAVLDPAPRAATLLAGGGGAQVLHLDGTAFLDTLREDPSIGAGLLRVMARRLRGGTLPAERH